MRTVLLTVALLCPISPVVHGENRVAEIDKGVGLTDVYSAYTPEPRTPFAPNILPVNITVTTPAKRARMPDTIELSVRILNEDKIPQNIGTETCGVHRLSGWVADNDAFNVQQGGSCRSNLIPPVAIVLQPGKFYSQTCAVSFKQGQTKPGPIKFRLGLQYERHVPAWSNGIELEIVP